MKLIAKCAIYAGAGRIAPGSSFEVADENGAVLVARGFAIADTSAPAPEPAPAPAPEPEQVVEQPAQPKAKAAKPAKSHAT